MRYFEGNNGWIIFNQEINPLDTLEVLVTGDFKVAKTIKEAEDIINGGNNETDSYSTS